MFFADVFSLPSTLFRTIQRLCIMINSYSGLALTQLAWITFVSLITCLGITFPVALIISTKNIFTLCPSFNLKVFESQQLYEIWQYMGSLIICPCVYNPIYSSSYSSYSSYSTVHLNIDVNMYGSFGPPCLSMKSTNSSHCVISVYEAWSCLGAETTSLPFDTQQIITVNVLFGNSVRVLVAFSPTCSPKSVAGCLWPGLPFILASQMLLAQWFKNISTHCWRIHSTLSKLTNGSQFLNVAKKSATTVSE